MDEKPFFEFKITDIKDNEIVELKKFHKSYFDIGNITNTASELKYLNQIKHSLNEEFGDPSDEFVKYFTRKVYPGTITQKVLEQFKLITKKACSLYISDILNERFKSALEKETQNEEPLTTITPAEQESSDGVVTSEDEIMGHMIVRAILSEKINAKRIVMRDALSYCAILLDDNNRKPICRFYFSEKKKSISIVDSNKSFVKTEISDLNDIYQLKKALFDTIDMYDK
ncbi:MULTISPECIES: hypothetical protein [unclassified Mucilaginibacter]|uniref:hypothetical protein n=1 Tax=unclassified Mucilaginibacter TaxID=2617802 RepID=UPI000A920E47|nr:MULTISPECIES: hypothetical protein [unclassified Mucilaginibacter]